MPHESRIKKSLLNAKVNLLFYFLSLFISFFSRKIFLSALGDNFVGLSGTLGNLLNFLNLAELGVASAIGYLLYKPLFADDHQKINEIISVFGYIYRKIGFIIGGAGCLLSCFLPWIFPDTPFSYGVIYFAYFSMLTSSLLSYFFNYKQTLLGADQRNYVVTIYYQSAVIVKNLLQMAVAYYTGNYYLWIALELLLGIFYAFILNVKIKQVYPWLEGSIRQGKQLFKSYPEVISYTKQLFVHKNYKKNTKHILGVDGNPIPHCRLRVVRVVAIDRTFHHFVVRRKLHSSLLRFYSAHHQFVHQLYTGCSRSVSIRLRPIL